MPIILVRFLLALMLWRVWRLKISLNLSPSWMKQNTHGFQKV